MEGKFIEVLLDICDIIEPHSPFSAQIGRVALSTPGINFIDGFIDNSHTSWEKVKKRDIEGLKIAFTPMCMGYESVIEGIILSLSDEDKERVFECVDHLIRISLTYIHKGRKPIGREYTEEFHPEVKLRNLFKIFV